MTLFITAVIAGLGIGSIYGMLALGYTVVVRSTGIFNVAQGDLMMAGVLIAYFALDEWHLPQLVALLFIVAAVVAISLVEERIAVRPFITRSAGGGLGWFISTLGFAFILETAGTVLYGDRPIQSIPGALPSKSIYVGSVAIAPKFILALVVMCAMATILELFYRRSWLGLAMRAISENREVSELRGIDVRRLSQFAFAIAGLVTGIAAFAVAPIVSADPTIGLTYGLKAFIALAVGGFGSIRGSVIGGLLLGVAEQLFDLYLSSNYEILAGLLLVLVVLATRPSGLFGVRSVREV
jgi:branched-chain amino acid transport system permease protein